MNAIIDPKNVFITGSGGGGGGKGGGGGGGSEEAPNTLRSTAKAELIELISEGEIVGLVDGLKSIFLDETPVMNTSGSMNFKGFAYQERVGLPDQEHLPGDIGVQTTNSVEAEVRYELPVIRTINEQNADAVRVVIRLPALLSQDNETGDMNPASVSYAIDVRPYGGGWSNVITRDIRNQKCTSVYQRDEMVELPEGGHPWDIRVRRLTADSDSVYLQNETWWESFVTIVRGKYTYPNSALIRCTLDAEEMGESIPERAYHVKGLIIEIPSNYDGETRTYDGIWDGTFKRGWTNNPVWILRTLMTHPRYGLGDFIDDTRVDKWGLYQIAQYCDEEVKSGFKDPEGADIMEPRFVFNGVINTREEAYRVIQNIVSCFRGMAFWSHGQIFSVADMPEDPKKLVAPADVIDGKFEYSGTAQKSRHSVALVNWNDPKDFYRPAVEVVIDDEALQKYGWREKRVQTYGVTSRGQAHRLGKWVLDVEQNETETVTYIASWDHAEVRPGNIIAVADPRKAQVRTGGRMASYDAATLSVELDGVFEPADGETYSLMIELPTGEIDLREITSFSTADERTTVTINQILTEAPVVGAMWVVTGGDVNPRQYRVVATKETEQNLFEITALFHDPNKYARVEQGLVLDDIPYTRPRNASTAPISANAIETIYYKDGMPRSQITLSWQPSNDFLARGFDVAVDGPDGTYALARTNQVTVVLDNTSAGTYTFRITAVNRLGLISDPLEYTFVAKGWAGVDAPYIGGVTLENSSNGTTFSGSGPTITWSNEFPTSGSDFASGTTDEQGNPFYKHNVVRVYDDSSGDLLREVNIKGTAYTYPLEANILDNGAHSRGASRDLRFDVAVEDVNGRVSSFATLSCVNPVPGTITPSVEGMYRGLNVSWPSSSDLDLAGYRVWVSTEQGFDPLVTTPAWEGMGNNVIVPTSETTTHYVRMAAIDHFGDESLNISAEVDGTPLSLELDSDPPAIPATPTLTQTIQEAPDGTTYVDLRASWTPNTDDDLSYYIVEIKEGSGSFVAFTTTTPNYVLRGKSGVTYTVQVAAVDTAGNRSEYSDQEFLTLVGDTTPPGQVTGLVANPAFRSNWLKWDAAPEADLSHYEIFVSETNAAPAAGDSGSFTVGGTATVHSDLPAGAERFYWVRAVDVSGNKGTWSAVASATTLQVGSGDIGNTVIGANNIATGTLQTLAASINTAWITSAHIVELDAAKIKAGTVLAGTITVDGTSLADIKQGGVDPAATINSGSTTIDPGKVKISGAATLSSWLDGNDATLINGGAISANSIEVNKLKIGARGISTIGIKFQHNGAVLSWTAGSISYVDDAGATQTVSIAAGSVTSTANRFVYWTKGATALATTTSAATANGADRVIMATYSTATGVVPLYGGTVIEGSNIRAGSIAADRLNVTSLSAVSASFGTITAGVARSSDSKMIIDLDNKRILISD